MEEIFAIGDRVTVMRNGKYIGTRVIKETSRDELVRLMVGTAVDKAARPTAPGNRATLLNVSGLSGARIRNIEFTLKAGEVLGLGGLHGQGQSDLLLTLYGAMARKGGTVMLDGRNLGHASPLASLSEGICYVSGDRGRAGALQGRPILENLTLAQLARSRTLIAHRSRLAFAVQPLISKLKLKFGGFGHAIGTLSGGNQQKVILGRALAATPRVLLLDDPTKGIDVEAKRDLYALLADLCAEGAAVILYSSEDSELLDNADRVLVFNGGEVVDEISGARLTEFDLYSAALKSAA
jgi:ribose transport system ATP-binding protein